MGKRVAKPVVTARAKANVEAVAKVAYIRKRTTSEVIPPDVTRARATAWLDLISPLTEWAGLKGDALRQKREVLGLQREDTLAEIARRFAQRRSRRKKEIPIPNKFLVPFLEQSSLEDRNSPLVDLWANLLVSATEEFAQNHIYFISVISRISQAQAKIFTGMIGSENLSALEKARDQIAATYEFHAIQDFVTEIINRRDPQDDDEFSEEIVELFYMAGISVVHSAFENNETKAYRDISFPYGYYVDNDEADYSILSLLDLLGE